MSSKDEYVYELKYLKINSLNNTDLLEQNDIVDFVTYDTELQGQIESDDNESLQKFYKKIFPTIIANQDLYKTNIEQSKQFSKFALTDKKKFAQCVNRILATDFKESFIFNRQNLEDVTKILTYCFTEKKSKMSDVESAAKNIDFQKYNFQKMFLNENYLKNKNNNSRGSSKRTTVSSYMSESKEENDEALEYDDIKNKIKNMCYIDNDDKNILRSSDISSDINYNDKEMPKKLTKECFIYPKQNKEASNMMQGEQLPIEIIILLYKLRNVKCLIFQANEVNADFLKMANFLFLNNKWLFQHEIEEIKFDLGNEDIQNNLNELFNQRCTEFYNFFHNLKNSTYKNGSYKARTINCWEPEGDIYFKETKVKEENNNDNKFIYSGQSNKEKCYFDNDLCNIYNEYGNLTNFKYIRPIVYTNRIYSNKNNQKTEDMDDIIDKVMEGDEIKRAQRESVYVSSVNTHMNIRNSLTQAHTNAEMGTPELLKLFVKKNIYFFQMIAIYSYYLQALKKNLNKLNLYFQTPYSFEIQLMLRIIDATYDKFHFLAFTREIDSLKEINLSLNSLDNESFRRIFWLIKNSSSNLSSIKMSFFSSDINYYENSLLGFWSAKKLSVRKLFIEQKQFLINSNGDKERYLNNFILDRINLKEFCINLQYFFHLIKMNLINNLDEIIFRFDIPLPILNSEKYIILLVKFIINLLIMITFQNNHVHTFKLLSPELPFNSIKMPFIRELFKDICIKRENTGENLEVKLKKDENKKGETPMEASEQSQQQNELKDEKTDTNVKEEENNNNNIKEKESSKNLQGIQRGELNDNKTLKNLTLQLKIYHLPEIFNICLMNNLSGLKSINLGYLDDVTFIGFLNDFKLNSKKLLNLTSLKISLCSSVISYNNLEIYVIEYINTNSPKLEEKFLLTDLKISSEEKMAELAFLVYKKSTVPKLLIQINNDNENSRLLSKVFSKHMKEKDLMYDLLLIMQSPGYKEKLFTPNIIGCLASFLAKKSNRAIICKEDPYTSDN